MITKEAYKLVAAILHSEKAKAVKADNSEALTALASCQQALTEAFKANNPRFDAVAFAEACSDKGAIIGYDGSTLFMGARVELHPGCDLWAQGAKYGNIIGFSLTPADRVKVKLDHFTFAVSGPAENFRAAREGA